MFLIAGLGNPDRRYEKTRHNIGFDAVDALADRYGISIREKKHKALVGTGMIEGTKVLLAKPQTYMNLSGESIAEIIHFYKLDAESEMLVIFDDISLAPGNIRVRKKGSAGGHNGIKSIIACTGTQNFMYQNRRGGKATGLGPGGLCAGTFYGGGPCPGGGRHKGCRTCCGPDGTGVCGQGNE